jgi:acetyl-CoA carboxylase carboxyltransferase component
MVDDTSEFSAMRAQIRQTMGGTAKVRALRLSGKRTARDHIAAICDDGSFGEIGTLAGMPAGTSTAAAGDGRICGHGTMAGRAVAFMADDVTVKRASSTALNARKTDRLVHQARLAGEPIVYFGEAGGARLPDVLHGDVFASEPIYPWLFDADRPPLVTAIVGQSYGGSSFIAARSDIVVMLEGSVMALTSPRVLRIATGASISDEALGGAQVVAQRTGLVDIVAASLEELDDCLRKVIDLITRPAGSPTPPTSSARDLRGLVPERATETYDVKAVVEAIVDGGSFLELGRRRGPSLLTGIGRVAGRAVGVVASQPRSESGALSPASCEKAIRLMRLCARFRFPVIYLVDTPGFQVGPDVEHNGMLERAMDLIDINTASPCPVITVVIRKAFGLAFFAMCSPTHGGDLVVAWPDATIGFMAPEVAANVLYAEELEALDREHRMTRLAERAGTLGSGSSAMDVAAAMGIDEIIDPAETVAAIRRFVERCP